MPEHETPCPELKVLSRRVDAHETSIKLLEKQHETYERASLQFLGKSAREEEGIHKRLDIMGRDIHSIPEMVSSKLAECRIEMRTEIDKSYPRKHEVITPKVLMMATSLLAIILVAGMSVTMVVWDKIDDASHQAHTL